MHVTNQDEVNYILPVELRQLIQEGALFQLIDVRETAEHEEKNIGGELIPLNEIVANHERLCKDRPVIIYCKVGVRSQIAIQRLQAKYGFKNLYNLKGGITAYLVSS
jgi:rhodanese-related sulfurtransferase